MAWTTSTWIVAGVFPVLLVVSLLIAWGRGAKDVGIVLAGALVVAAGFSVVTRTEVLLKQWVLVSVVVAICAVVRAERFAVGIGAPVFLLLFGALSLGPHLAPTTTDWTATAHCPLTRDQFWRPPTMQTGDKWPSIETEEGASKLLVRGVEVTPVGEPLGAASRDEPVAEVVLPQAAVTVLREMHEYSESAFQRAVGLGLTRLPAFGFWPDTALPLCDPPPALATPPVEGRRTRADRDEDNFYTRRGRRVREEPQGPTARWVAERVQLVGLLKSRTPRVYDIQGTPTMEKIATASARPLDGFERAALSRLREGEEVVVSARPNEIRMMGAIRAAERCTVCHEVSSRTVLGAFSYRLRPGLDDAEPAVAEVPGHGF